MERVPEAVKKLLKKYAKGESGATRRTCYYKLLETPVPSTETKSADSEGHQGQESDGWSVCVYVH